MRKKKKLDVITTVDCPLRGHAHKLLLVPHPENPALVVALCGKRIVVQRRAAVATRPADPAWTYRVPKTEGE